METETSQPPRGTSTAPETGAMVKLKPLRDGIKELEAAYELKRASANAFKEKVDAIAEKSGIEKSVIRAYIAARMAESSEKAERKAEQARQLQLVFDEVGM